MDAARYLKETPMLDYSSVMIQSLIAEKGWRELDAFHQIKEIYRFCRDEILFGYNVSDGIPASCVLADGMASAIPKGRCLWPFCGPWDSLPGSWLYHR